MSKATIQNPKHFTPLFEEYDLVRITGERDNNCEALIRDCSRSSEYSGHSTSYSLWVKGHGHCAWYDEPDLELIERGRHDLKEIWKKEVDDRIAIESDLDWIFKHGPELADSAPGASVQALADCLKLGSLWGSRGEGITYWQNSMTIMGIAEPFLKSKDRAGWDALVENYLAERRDH